MTSKEPQATMGPSAEANTDKRIDKKKRKKI